MPTFDHLGRRGIAFLVDVVVVLVLVIVIVQAAIAMQVQLTGWIFYLVAALYLGLLPATPLQATPGKRMAGLRVCDAAGRRIGIGRALLRLVAFVPSIAIAGAGVLLAAFTPRRQALHDLAAGTFVVSRGATPEAIAQVPPPVTWANRIGVGLALAVLALGVQLFVQIYNDRRARENAIALLNGIEPYKAEVAKALRASAAMPPAGSLPRNARAMSARADGTIVIEVSDDLFAGGRLLLRPATNAKGEVMWTCRAEKIHGGLLPGWCRD